MAFRTISVELRANVASFTAQMGAAAKSTEQFGREVGQLAATSNEAIRTAGKMGVVVGGTIVAGFALAANQASKFETGMRNVNSIMKQSEAEFRRTSDAVLDISRRVPQAATTLADGLYDIASSGFQGAEGLQVLEASAVAATAGMTNTATAAKAITAALNAYGDSASMAADVSDIFFQTVNLGVVTFEELAQGVGDWVGTAAALGVELDDASAALATMTLSGVQAAEASTSLNRVMQAFIKPSEDMTATLEDLGYTSGVAAVEALGLRGAVMAVDEATGGSIEATAGLYREVRAIRGVLALTAADGENYAKVFEEITDETSRAGAAQAAYEEQSKAFSVQLDLALSSLNAVAIEIGTHFLPMLTSAAQLVGNMADAFAGLPGPVKGMVTTFAGLTGGIALLGGAAILAAPKIQKFQMALLDLATRPGGSAGATRAIQGLGGAFGMLGRALPVVGTALAIAALEMQEHGRETAAAADAAEAYADALERQGTALGAITQLESTRRLQDQIDGLGESAEVFAETLERQPYLVEDFANRASGAFQGMGMDADRLRGLLEESGLAGTAFASEIQTAFGNLSSGEMFDLLNQLGLLSGAYQQARADTSDAADATSEEAAAAFEEASRQAEELGINLDETSELAAKTAEEMAAIKEATDPVIFSMLEMGTVTIEQAEAMQKAMDGYVSSVEQAFAQINNPLAVHSELLASQEEAAREWAEAQAAATEDTSDTWEDYYSDQKVSAADFVAGMAQTAADTEQFMDDIQAAITHGYDPQLIAELLQAGPEQAGPILETLLSDHSGTMVGMVNEAQEKLRELNVVAAEMARLTHLATTNATDQMTSDLSTAMAIVQTNMGEGGRKSAEALAEELRVGVSEVERIAAAYGITLAEGVNPLLRGIGRNPINVGGVRVFAAGGQVPGEGDGDTVPAMLTPGEFVIRKAAVKVLGVDTLHRLNQADRRRYAQGGFVTAADVPSPPSAAQWGTMVGHTGDESMDHLYGEVRDWVEKNAVPQGSATGLDPVFRGMFDRYNQALGGILRIISGFRSRAQQANLYARYLAGTGNLAAPPGRSMHERGLAIDHAPRASSGMMATARGFGLHYPVRGEPWHVEPVRTATYDQGGLLQPGYTLAYNGTGRPEMVARFADGGLVARSVQGVHARYAYEQSGAQLALTAGYSTDDAARMGQAWADAADKLGEATATMLMHQKLGVQGYQDAVTAILEAEENLKSGLEALYDARQTQLDIAFAEDAISTDEYLDVLRDRHARLVELYGYWSREAHAVREEIRAIDEGIVDDARASTEKLQRTRDEAFQHLNDLLDQQARLQAQIERSQADHHARLRRLEQDLARDRADAIAARADELRDWIALDERFVAGWGNTVGALTRNVADQVQAFTDWQDALAAARERGVSEQVIGMLGLDEGPEALAQLRMFSTATADEIEALNDTVARRQEQAGEQARAEADQQFSELGRMLRDMRERFAAEVERLNEEFLAEQAEFGAELAALGAEQGRSFSAAIEAGIRSGIPGIRAAAAEARAAMAELEAAQQALANAGAGGGGGGGGGSTSTTRTSTRSTSTMTAADRAFAEWIQNPANKAYYEWKTGMPAYHTGTSYVPVTGPATVHRGERIFSVPDNAALISAVRGLGAQPAPVVSVAIDVDRMKAVVRTEAAGVIDERTIDVQIAGER